MRRKTVFIVLAIIGMALVWSASASAAQQPREQFMPTLAYNPHPEVQNFILMWVEDRGDGKDIFAKRLFQNGLPQGGPTRNGWQVIRDESAYNRRVPPPGPRADPDLVYNPARQEFMLVYSENTGETDGWDVFAVRASSAGYAQGNPRKIAGGPGDQQHPDVAILGDADSRTDDYIIVWDDNARDVDEIWGVRLHANGIPRSAPYPLVRNASNASDPTTSGSQVAWVDDRDGQTNIWSQRLKNGLPNGAESSVSGALEDEFNPRFGSGGLIWNIYDPSTGVDIVGVQVLENARVRGTRSPVLVPAADQNWPDMDNNVLVFADNRSGEYDLYAIRLSGSARITARGRDFPVMTDSATP